MEDGSSQRLLIYFYFLGLKNDCGTASPVMRVDPTTWGRPSVRRVGNKSVFIK